MRIKRVTYKLNPDESEIFQQFCDQLRRTGERDFVGMDRSEIAKRALFYAIADARRRAEEMELARLEQAARHTPTDEEQVANTHLASSTNQEEQQNATDNSSEIVGSTPRGDASGSTDTTAHTNETDTPTETAGV